MLQSKVMGMSGELLPSSNVVIGIPTFKRPHGLRRVLEGIAKQQDVPCALRVLVADNEGPEGAGTAVARDMAAGGYPFPLTVIPVPERGLVPVRNALMREAFGKLGADALIMVDDDVWVEENWLAALVAMQRQTRADVVGSKVLPDFEGGEPAWAPRLMFIYYWPDRGAGIAPTVTATTSVLFGKTVYACALEHGFFDPAFSLTGGEDTEFFERLKQHGVVFAFAPDSIVHEVYGPSRSTRRWAMRRAFRTGNVGMRHFGIFYPPATAAVFAREVFRIVAGLGAGALLTLVYPFSPARGMKGLVIFSSQIGKIYGLLGRHVEEYKVTHGA